MKLLGLQRVDGGIAIGLPSGRQVLVALPSDRKRAAFLLGERLFKLLDDPTEPPARRVATPAPPTPPRPRPHPSEPYGDLMVAVHSGIDAGRTLGDIWRSLRGGTR